MVIPARLELATFGLGNRCSIQLSYGTTACSIAERRKMGHRLGEPVFAQELQRQADAFVGLLDLQQVPGAFDEAVVVAALEA